MRHETWLGVEMRHLAALDAIEREGSFRLAASTLGYSQSAVSSQIATLERLVGTRLVERPGRAATRARLTRGGEVLLRHARAIRAELAEAREELAECDAAGRVRVGLFEGIGGTFIGPIAAAAAAADPEVFFTPVEARTSDELLDRLEAGGLELAVVALPVRRPGVRAHLVLRDAYELLLPPAHELAAVPGPIGLTCLRDVPFTVFGNGAVAGRLGRALAAAGIEPAETVALSDPPTIAALVVSGARAALVPGLVARACPHVASRRVELPLPARLLAVAHRADAELDAGARVVFEAVRRASSRLVLGADVVGRGP